MLQYIGEVRSAKLSERKDKNTGKIEYSTQVTLEQVIVDKNGEDEIETKNFFLPHDDLDFLKSIKGKYLLIQMRFLQVKTGTYLFEDEDFDYLVFDKNPHDFSLKRDDPKLKKAS